MTYKYLFFNDYSEGAHPRILDALNRANSTQQLGYGDDESCAEAIGLIRQKIANQAAQVHFVSGGTQANLVALASILKPFESVIAAATAHINVHEAGAIEATGHKIHNIPSADGKLTPSAIREVALTHAGEHMVKPRAVFVSQATELGTTYTRAELEDLSITCKESGLYFYLDGARLGPALAASAGCWTLSDIARLTDLFYIGGTKNGLLLGEAIVITNRDLQEEFRYHLKQRGALLAKGRIFGVQFAELFRDELFVEIARHANDMAQALAKGIEACGYRHLVNAPTNQIFPILPNPVIEKLKGKYGFYVWSTVDDNHSCIRLVTSWATPQCAVDEFLADLKICSV